MNLPHLKKLLVKHGISQTDLARILGRDKSVITNLFQGRRQLKADEAMVIARHVGVPVAEVYGVHEPHAALREPSVLIPFQHEPERGRKRPNIIKKDGQFYFEMDESIGHSPKTFALEAPDDSMNLSGILQGDIVISELDRPCKPGQIVVAQHYHNKGAKTVIRHYEPPFLRPHCMNASFKLLSLENEEARLIAPVLKLIRSY